MDDANGSVGAWAKSYYFAVRAAMESILRPYDLGSTQFYVLYQLANRGPTMQRDLGRVLQIERATLSGIVATLVRKGLIDQLPGSEDQRQRVLRLTGDGTRLWDPAARSARPHPGDRVRGLRSRGAGGGRPGAPGGHAATQRAPGRRQARPRPWTPTAALTRQERREGIGGGAAPGDDLGPSSADDGGGRHLPVQPEVTMESPAAIPEILGCRPSPPGPTGEKINTLISNGPWLYRTRQRGPDPRGTRLQGNCATPRCTIRTAASREVWPLKPRSLHETIDAHCPFVNDVVGQRTSCGSLEFCYCLDRRGSRTDPGH